ncbi:unnamed protein product [Ceratitis capitata]|uniref:(Mediterranean fruit fly) hypothetical protein n=1 Tax=Ceratitis capitata TaxID=7213 RepID=A0A811UQE2_CERCA|nr:unnamed protein product [Ceratitis capitata]
MDREKMNNQPPNVPESRNPSNDIQNREERPMMLNTWTQTTSTDLGVNENVSLNSNLEDSRERQLLQRIRELDEKVREQNRTIVAQADILSRQNQIIDSRNSGHQQVSAIIVNPQSLQRPRRLVSLTPTVMQTFNEPSSSTQESRQNITPFSIQDQTPRSARNLNSHPMSYTIIADGAYGQEPIEIQISEETNEMNLNCSADSERLEICLSEPKQNETRESNINCEPRDQVKQIDQPSEILETPSSTSRPFEAYNQPQCMPTQGLSPEELQPSTSKHCRPISRTSTTRSLSPEELQPSTSKHCRALLPKNAKDLNKIGKIKKEPKSPKNMIAKIEPIRREYTIMGPNRTLIEVSVFDQITWDNPSAATRRLMSALFSREILASHSLTGRPSPAFKDKPVKRKLDEKKIEDIIHIVSRKCGVTEKEVRSVITTKCADENKMWRLSESKRKSEEEKNKENDDI